MFKYIAMGVAAAAVGIGAGFYLKKRKMRKLRKQRPSFVILKRTSTALRRSAAPSTMRSGRQSFRRICRSAQTKIWLSCMRPWKSFTWHKKIKEVLSSLYFFIKYHSFAVSSSNCFCLSSSACNIRDIPCAVIIVPTNTPISYAMLATMAMQSIIMNTMSILYGYGTNVIAEEIVTHMTMNSLKLVKIRGISINILLMDDNTVSQIFLPYPQFYS